VDDALTDDRVALHEGPFVVAQRSGLVEDRVGDGALADVVQLGCDSDPLNVELWKAALTAHRLRQLGDVACVVVQVGAALAEGGEQHVRALATGRCTPDLLLVHALIGESQRILSRRRLGADANAAERAADVERLAGFRQRLRRAPHERRLGFPVDRREHAELVAAGVEDPLEIAAQRTPVGSAVSESVSASTRLTASSRPFSTTSRSAIVRAPTERRYKSPKPATSKRITTAEPIVARISALPDRCL